MLPVISNELTKTQIKVIADQTAQDIIDNGQDVIKIADTIAKIELFLAELKKSPEYLDYLISEVAKFGKSTTTNTGTKFELAEVGVKYDFSQCNDDELKKMEDEFAVLEDKIKERKDFLKALSPKGIDIMTEEGELVTLYPPSRSSKSSVKCTITK